MDTRRRHAALLVVWEDAAGIHALDGTQRDQGMANCAELITGWSSFAPAYLNLNTEMSTTWICGLICFGAQAL